jgi:hypothetical protein
MVIDQAGSLQVRIQDRATNKLKAAAFHVFAELI